jgi:hypothetical protein
VVIIDEELKSQAVYDHFDQILGTVVERAHGVDLERVGLPRGHIPIIDHCFSEDEVWRIIRSMPPDKAPGPDDFIGHFYQTTRPIIKRDIMQALSALWSLDARSLYLLNHAYMVLLRKKKDAEEIEDYMSISLIHNSSKLFAKLLSSRLAPHMHQLVMPNQIAFIRGRAIHDNFRAIESSAKLLHAPGRSCILLKVDTEKALGTVNWSFLHDLLNHLGFSRRLIN